MPKCKGCCSCFGCDILDCRQCEEDLNKFPPCVLKKIKDAAAEFASKYPKDDQKIAAALNRILDDSPFSDGSKPNYNQKSDVKAESHRSVGNDQLKNKDLDMAHYYYTASVAYATPNSPTLAFGYANRAVVLATQKHYFDAIADNQRALKCGYPKHLVYKIHSRLAKNYENVGQYGRALTCLNASLKCLDDSDFSQEAKEKFKKEHLQPVLNACNAEGEEDEDVLQDLTQEQLIGVDKLEVPSLGTDFNSELPSLANSVALKYNEKFGRHLVATKDIEIGEIVAIEDPYAAMVTIDETPKNCSHCFKCCRTLLPCSVCTWAMFCSHSCMLEAEPYHKLECLYLMSVRDEALSATNDCTEMADRCQMGIRILTRYGYDALLKFLKSYRNPKLKTNEQRRNAGFNSDKKYISSDLNTIFNVNCRSVPVTEPSLIYRNSFLVGNILILMKLNQFPFCYKLGSFLYKFIASNNVINGCSALHSYKAEYSAEQSRIDDFGIGIYPSTALMNTSCCANTYDVFYGKTRVVHAYKNIKKGEQIFASQTIHLFKYFPLEQRQHFYKRHYLFTCTCEACEKNWPCKDKIPQFPTYSENESELNLKLTAARIKLFNLSMHADCDMNVIITSKTFPLYKDYLKLLEANNKTLNHFYYRILEWVKTYFIKQGMHVGDVEFPGDVIIHDVSKLPPDFFAGLLSSPNIIAFKQFKK